MLKYILLNKFKKIDKKIIWALKIKKVKFNKNIII